MHGSQSLMERSCKILLSYISVSVITLRAAVLKCGFPAWFSCSCEGKMKTKFFQQKFTLSHAARADTNPKGTLFKACRCFFMSSQKAFRSCPHDF